MSVRILSQARGKIGYLFAIILLCAGYFNYLAVIESVVFFFRISSLTGQILVNKFLSVCNCTFEIVKLTYSFFKILYEDSLIFLKDATEKFTFVIYLLKELYLFLENFVCKFLKILFDFFESILNFFGIVQGTVSTVKEGVYLTGSTIWRFFVDLPETVISIVIGMNEFIKNTFAEIIICILKVKESISQSFEKTYLFLFDVPLDSVYGLIIGALLLTIFCIKFKNICCITSSMLLKIYQQTVSCGTSLWSGRFLERKGGPKNGYTIEDDERLCIVCQHQPKEIIIFPCKHLCLCKDCSAELEKNYPICPICRSEIAETLKVYL